MSTLTNTTRPSFFKDFMKVLPWGGGITSAVVLTPFGAAGLAGTIWVILAIFRFHFIVKGLIGIILLFTLGWFIIPVNVLATIGYRYYRDDYYPTEVKKRAIVKRDPKIIDAEWNEV